MFGNNSFGNNSFGGTAFGSGFGTTPTMGAFGSTAQAPAQRSSPVGTTIRFVPLTGTDSVQKAGSNAGPSQITTRHQIISAMKEYESKSVDELRLEDYAANRKVGQPQTAFNSSPFGSMQPSTSQQNTSIFGSNTQPAPNLFATPTQNQGTSIFGQQKTGFDMNNSSNIFSSSLNKPATTVSNSPFNIGTPFPAPNSNMFAAPTSSTGSIFSNTTNAPVFSTASQNAPTQVQPFGTTNSIFGDAPKTNSVFGSNNLFNTQPKSGFDLNSTSGAGGLFNSPNKPPTTTTTTSLFQTSFNTTPFNSMQPSTSQQNTSIFGSNTQPAPNLFATPTQNQGTSIFGQQKTGFDMNSSSNIFNSAPNKPATTTPFNIGAPFSTPATNMFAAPTSNTGSIFSTNTNSNTSGFLNTNQNAPTQTQTSGANTSIFGETPKSTGIFGSTSLFSTQPKTGFDLNNTTAVGGLFNSPNKPPTAAATSLFQTNFNTTSFSPMQPSALQQSPTNVQQSPHQSPDLLLNRLKTLPYGETSLNPYDSSLGSLKFTTDPKTINQYKMSAKTNVKLNKPTNTEETKTNSVLFDELDDTNDDLKCAIDVFVPKRNVKTFELELKPHEAENDDARANDSSIASPSFRQDPVHVNDESIDTTEVDRSAATEVAADQANSSPIHSLSIPPDPVKITDDSLSSGADSAQKTGFDAETLQITTRHQILRNAIDLLLDDYDDQDLSHGTKRLAIQNFSTTSYDRPIVAGASVPEQLKVRDIKLKPDLHAAKNKITRDIMSVCVAGSPKVRFFNGSRKFCIVRMDTVSIQELKLVPTTSDNALTHDLEERLETFLEDNSLVTPLNMDPTLAPYIETYDFISNASSHDLLHALYGNLSSKTPYAKQYERLNRVVDWLASTNRSLPPPTNLYQLIIYHMSCDRYDLASLLAIENNHPRLAMLVATLNLNKDLMLEQLSSWRLSTADQYIDPDLLKIYILLAGLTEWKLSNDVTVHSLRGLRWTQQLCLLSLHVTSFVTEPEKYGFHMLPLYIKRLDTNTNDVDYHILARHSPADILSAADSLIEEWFLLESLKSFHVINSEAECANSDIIHCNLASQLGPIDLRWACFVALHIINNEVRNKVLINCLERNYKQYFETKQDLDKSHGPMTVESWLIEKLKIPREFIENSVALAGK